VTERLVQRAALAGRVVEDLSYAAVAPGELTADLAETDRPPSYKDGGLFVFSDVPDGEYLLRLGGRRFQTRTLAVTLPPPALLLALPGDDELVVVVRAVDAGQRRILFNAVTLPRRIAAGAPVLAPGLETALEAELEPGAVISARLESVEGLAPGALVRIVRDRSIRLKLDPHAPLPDGATRLVGRVSVAGFPATPVAGAAVRLAAAGGAEVLLEELAGARIATLGEDEDRRVLGTETDVAVRTDGAGEYHLYFLDADFPSEVTLEVSRDGFVPGTVTRQVSPGRRNRIDVELDLA
jgi:hypothetical protein